MVLSRLLFSLFLLSLVLISSAYKYESHDNFQNQFHDQTTQNDNFLPTDFLGHPLPNVFAIQGRVLCNSGSTYFPLQGAIMKITCLREDYNSYKTLSSISCHETNENGLFYETLSPWKLKVKSLNIEGCKTYLEYSSLESCKIPTDVNSRIIGDLLSSTQVLQDKSLLYTVGPFIYTSKPYDHSNIPNNCPVANPNDVLIPTPNDLSVSTPNDDVPIPSKSTTPNGY